MKYTDRLLDNKTFLKIMRHVKDLEKDRVYCHHELEHALDVARIAWIYYLEDERQDRLSGISELCPEEILEQKKEGSDSGEPERTLNIKIKEEDSESGEAAKDFEFGEEKKDSTEEKEYVVNKDFIYTAALLHDIGRAAQYESGVHHSIAGLQIAAGILEEIGFPEKEAQAVLAVVAEHPLSAGQTSAQKAEIVSDERTQEAERKNEDIEAAGKRFRNPESSQNEKNNEDLLLFYITRADHDCRLCFFCEAKESCKWSEGERNQTVLS